jgi:hypothetical protein
MNSHWHGVLGVLDEAALAIMAEELLEMGAYRRRSSMNK